MNVLTWTRIKADNHYQTLPQAGQYVTWKEGDDRIYDGRYLGQYLWVRDSGGYTIGSDKVVQWRARA